MHERYRFENGVFRQFKEGEKLIRGGGIELNAFMLETIKKPHIVIHGGKCEYLVLSLLSFEVIKGSPNKFDQDEWDAASDRAREHQESLTAQFQEMKDI